MYLECISMQGKNSSGGKCFMATRCLLKNSWQLCKEATRKVYRGFMMEPQSLGDFDAAKRCDASEEPKMFSNHSNFKHNQTVLLLLSSQSPPCLISRPSFEARQLWSLLDKSSVLNAIYLLVRHGAMTYELCYCWYLMIPRPGLSHVVFLVIL